MADLAIQPNGQIIAWDDTAQNWRPATDEEMGEFYGQTRLSPGEKARMAAQGATLGFGDEIAGVLASGRTSGPEYTAARDASRMRLEEMQSRDPTGATAYEIGGGMAAMGPSPAVVGRVAPRLPAWLQGVVGGGAGGAVAGAGEARAPEPGQIASPADYAAPVAQNAALGAGTAGIAYPIIARGAAPMAAAAMSQSIGRMAPNQAAYRSIARRLEQEGRTPEDIEAMIGRGQRETLVDVSPNVRADAEAIATTTPSGRDIVEESLGVRSEQTGNFLRDKLRDDFGFNQNRIDTTKDIERFQRETLGEQYREIGDVPLAGNKALENLARVPAIQSLWKSVANANRNTAMARGQMVSGGPTSDMMPTFEGWKQIATALNGRINQAMRSGDTAQAGRLREFRNAINEQLDANLDGYALLRSQWADSERAKEILTEGRRFFSMDEDELAEYTASLSPAEMQYFRLAATDAIRSKFHEASAPRGRAGESAMRKMGARAKMRSLYSDPQRADDMNDLLATLERQQGAYEQLTRGSPTARRLAAAGNFDDEMLGMVADYALGNPSQGGMRSALEWLSQMATRMRVPDTIRERILQSAVSNDPKDFLTAWKKLRASTPRQAFSAATGGMDAAGMAALIASGAAPQYSE